MNGDRFSRGVQLRRTAPLDQLLLILPDRIQTTVKHLPLAQFRQCGLLTQDGLIRLRPIHYLETGSHPLGLTRGSVKLTGPMIRDQRKPGVFRRA